MNFEVVSEVETMVEDYDQTLENTKLPATVDFDHGLCLSDHGLYRVADGRDCNKQTYIRKPK